MVHRNETDGQGPNRPVIGVVGHGAMCSQIAGRLLFQGNRVPRTNRTEAKAGSLIDGRQMPRQVTPTPDILIGKVTDSDAPYGPAPEFNTT